MRMAPHPVVRRSGLLPVIFVFMIIMADAALAFVPGWPSSRLGSAKGLHRRTGMRVYSAWGEGVGLLSEEKPVDLAPTSSNAGGSGNNWVDMVLRKKEEFVAAVLSMEHQAQLEVAEALIMAIRRFTHGGMLPAADGTVPKLDKEQRKMLNGLVPEVIRIMDRLEKSGLEDARVFLYITEALGYDLHLHTVMKAAVHLPRIASNIQHLVDKHPQMLGGAPYIVKGMMSLNAPKPLRNVGSARENFEMAHQIAPRNPRNKYFCGVAAFLQKDYRVSYEYFRDALELCQFPDADVLESDRAYLESQCRQGVEMARAKLR